MVIGVGAAIVASTRFGAPGLLIESGVPGIASDGAGANVCGVRDEA